MEDSGVGHKKLLVARSDEESKEICERMQFLCHKLHSAITPQILARFPRSKIRQKALKDTFRTMPKMYQSNQYSSRYQLISVGH